VPNTSILFSNLPKYDKICSGSKNLYQEIDISKYCENDISCTMYEKIDTPFKFRAEQCAEMLYILMIYPPENKNPNDEMSISAEYIDDTPWYTVSGGVHDVVNSKTEWGKRHEDTCESTVRCSLITCQYPTENKREEKVWVPRVLDYQEREDYCSYSGLLLTGYGAEPLDSYGMLTIIIGIVSIFFATCFWAGCYYNLRIYQNKRPPFSVPRFWPQCCFPQPKNNYNYSFEEGDDSQISFDVLDNQGRGSTTKRGTTKYRAPQFYFEDE